MSEDKFTPRHPGKKLVTIFTQANSKPEISTEGIKYITNVFKSYGWKLQDSIHFCGSTVPDLTVLEELSLRAFKDGENLVG